MPSERRWAAKRGIVGPEVRRRYPRLLLITKWPIQKQGNAILTEKIGEGITGATIRRIWDTTTTRKELHCTDMAFFCREGRRRGLCIDSPR